MGEAENLLRELIAWKDGEDLRALLCRAVTLLGPQIIVDLPAEPAEARRVLEEAVLDYLAR